MPVVAIPSACNYLTEHVFSSMKQALPLVDVVLHESVVYELSSFLQQGRAHVGVTAFSEGEADKLMAQYREMGCVSGPLLEDEYYVFISSRHPLACKESLTVQDCSTLKLATYSNQMLKRNQLFQKKIFEVIGITQYVYVNSRENIMQMVAQNDAAGCFLHKMSAYSWYVTNGLIRALPVEGMHLMPSSHYLIHLESSALSPAERQVVDFIRRHYGDGDGALS
ncbi:substrate-binding domain-containing protein [uncultured Mailhella sp.]|uniref:substrate-binding domain-containing protein n=1 Tax=uncultured Mailhella sp. TaxID=1981031 RepID=UPI0025F19CE7|nr:substrate-binding domain-containing protein [uncultured Mailhella sp.]